MQIIRSLAAYCFFLILFTQAPAFAQLPGQLSIEQAVAELNDLMDVQNAFGIQDPNLSYGMRKALVLADLLLNPDGTLNPALCQTLKPYFVPESPLRYEENIGRILDQLDSSWEPFFDQITLPNADSSYANQILRGLFGISPNRPLTDRHAKWAVLASLFAPYNQGPVGDCFAVSVLIRDHEKYYLHTANDSAEIVQKGFITRLVRSREDNFFFLPILADNDYENNIAIDASGQISGTSLNLLDAPGFIAAGNAMGLSNISDYAQGILQILLSNPASTNGAVSVAQVIDAIAQTFFSQQTGLDQATLSSLGRYGFSCLTNNPVLRAVEDIFAAMAEDLPNDSTRGNINDCVEESLASTWKQIGTSEAAENLHQAISTAFDESYRLVYNGCIPLPAVAADGSSTSGGFQLFRRNLNNYSDIGVQVITPADFQSLVLDAISAVSSSVETSAEIQNIISQLQNYIQSGDFLKNALWAYDPTNKKMADPVANYQQLTRTPMQSCDGDNPFEVADIDTGVDCDSNVQTYTLKTLRR